jgi:hypothetical protein
MINDELYKVTYEGKKSSNLQGKLHSKKDLRLLILMALILSMKKVLNLGQN